MSDDDAIIVAVHPTRPGAYLALVDVEREIDRYVVEHARLQASVACLEARLAALQSQYDLR